MVSGQICHCGLGWSGLGGEGTVPQGPQTALNLLRVLEFALEGFTVNRRQHCLSGIESNCQASGWWVDQKGPWRQKLGQEWA